MLLRITLIVLLANTLIACSNDDVQQAFDHVQNAQNAIEDRDIARAVFEARAAVSLENKNPALRILLAEILLKAKQPAEAEISLRQAEEMDAAENDFILLKAQSLYDRKQYRDLLALSKSETLDQSPSFWAMSFEALWNNGQRRQAVRLLKRARVKFPDNVEITLKTARHAFLTNRPRSALKILIPLLNGDPENLQAWLLKGQVHEYLKEFETALKAYDKAVQLSFVPTNELLARMRMYAALGQAENMRADLKQINERFNNHPIIDLYRGYDLYLQNKYNDTKSIIDSVLAELSQEPGALYLAVASRAKEGDINVAKEYLEGLSPFKSSEVIKALTAFVLLSNSQFAQAEEILNSVDEPKSAYFKELKNSLDLYKAKEAELPKLAQLVSAPPATDIFHITAPIDHDYEATVEDIRRAINDRNIGIASKLVEQYRQDNPEDTQGLYLSALIAMSENRKTEAINYLENMLQINAMDFQATKLLGDLYFFSGNLPKAKEFFEKANVLDKSQPDPYKGLANIATAERAFDKAVTLLKSGLKVADDDRQMLNMLSSLYMKQKKYDDLLVLLKPYVEKEDADTFLQKRYAAVAYLKKDWQTARKTYDQLAVKLPNEANMKIMGANALLKMGKVNDYLTTMESLSQSDASGTAAIELAKYHLSKKDSVGAEKVLAGYNKAHPNNKNVLKMLSSLALSHKSYKDAIVYAESLFRIEKNNYQLIRLVDSYHLSGDSKSAIKKLNEWLKEYPEDAFTMGRLANLYMELEDINNALKTFQRVNKLKPDVPDVLNKLAWLLKDSDPKAALPYALKATEKAPKVANYQDTLAVVYLLNGEKQKAIEINDKLIKAFPDNKAFQKTRQMINAQ